MATKQYEIDKLEEVALWTVDVMTRVFKLIEKGKKGKKINGWDSLTFVKPLFDLMRIVGEYKQLGKEWIDLDEVEKATLNKIVQDNLEVEDSKAEEISKRVFFILMEVGDLISDLTVKK